MSSMSSTRLSSKLYHVLRSRGLVQTVFPDAKVTRLTEQLSSKQGLFYAGFDPTADSLHVGNLTVLMLALNAVKAGHKFIGLIGDSTASIGDPSGRSSERPILSSDEIEANSFGISADINRIFANYRKYFCKTSADHYEEPIILNNSSWYKSKNVISFISDIGREMRMGDLLSRSSIKSRLESPAGLSFCEFAYQVLQAYDWYHLYTTYNCTYQLGGSDQVGNITSGYFLINKLREELHQPHDKSKKEYLFGLLCPLLTDDLGRKFGKSSGSPVWLSPVKMTPFEFYQYFIRVEDNQVGKLLKFFTFIDDQQIDHIMNRFLEKPASRYAQERLATEVTLLVHGSDGLESAQRVTKALYKFDVGALGSLSIDEVKSVFSEDLLTTLPLPGLTGEEGDQVEYSLVDLAMKVSAFPNLSTAGRIIRAGGFHVNGEKITDPTVLFDVEKHILPNDLTLLRVGKKRYFIVRWK